MIKTRTLNNGVRVVMEHMPSVQSVSIGIWVHTGAVNETDKNAGVSHFVEHMMFKGTEQRTARQIAGDIDRIGGQMNAFTGKEATCYYVKSVAENYRKAADVLVDMLEHSLFDKTEMDRERRVICEEIKMTRDTPDDLAHDTLMDEIFRGDSLGNSILGTPTSLKRITRNVITDYVRTHYVRENIVVSVAGKFDEDDFCEYFENSFQTLGRELPENRMKRGEYRPSLRSLKKDIQQSHLCMGVRTIPLGDEDLYAERIMNNLFGGSMSSRLFQNIREQKGLAYSVCSMLGTFSTDGYMEIYAGVSHEKIRDAIEGIREELQTLKDAPVSGEELESSREQMKSGYVFSQESTSSRMMANGKNFMLIGRVFVPEEVIEGYNKVTVEDIERLKQMICDLDRYSAVVVSGTRVNLRSMMGRA
ncbi:M16 family metallopeptidase [Hornefia butyriciproducens]|nr:pitrilysin family protein [Hornefia butyriciproducens]